MQIIFTENDKRKILDVWRFKEVAGELAVTKQTVELDSNHWQFYDRLCIDQVSPSSGKQSRFNTLGNGY